MKEHNYAFQNADTRPRLQRRTQNICFVISISAVILKRNIKILFTWRWGTPGRCGNPPVHIISRMATALTL